MAHKAVFINNLKTPVGVMSFPHLRKPDEGREYSDGKFKATLLIPKGENGPAMVALKKAVLECAKQAWPKKSLTFKELMHPFRDGDDKENLTGYVGNVFITCKTKKRPRIVDAARNDIDVDALDDEIYGGCKARFVVTACSYESAGRPGVTLLLDIVQKLGDGERLGGGAASTTVLDDDVSAEASSEDATNDGLDDIATDSGDDDLFG